VEKKDRPSRGSNGCKILIGVGVALVIIGAIVAAIVIGRNMGGDEKYDD